MTMTTSRGVSGALGLLLAWVLTRYTFPGRRLLDALVDLPFALPTAVAGLVLVTLFDDTGWYGQFLEPNGIKVNYTQLGIIVAMSLTSIRFVVRTVQPVLEEIEVDFEDATRTLGASRWQVFARVVWPTILPAFMDGRVHRRQPAGTDRDRVAADLHPAGGISLRGGRRPRLPPRRWR